MSDVSYHDNIDLIQRLDFIYANNWFPDRDVVLSQLYLKLYVEV